MDSFQLQGNQESPLQFFHLLERLKNIPRRGWVVRGIPHPESDGDHMYRMAMMDAGDRFKCLKMVLIHDIGEALIGDIIPADGVSNEKKYQLEDLAIQYLSLLLPSTPDFAAEIRELFQEFEVGDTYEARIARDLDLFERALQAFEYEKRLHGIKKLDDMLEDLNTLVIPEVRDWAVVLAKEREGFWARKNESLNAIFIIGGPGAGKGTQCAKFAAKFNAHHICAGELLREEQKRQNSKYSDLINRHMLLNVPVPASLTISLMEEKMVEAYKAGKEVLLLDGFPRSEEQASEFEDTFSYKPQTILMRCTKETLFTRLRKRAVSSGRDDDESEGKRKKRVEDFEIKNEPVVKYLGAGRLTIVECDASDDIVYDRFEEAVQSLLAQNGFIWKDKKVSSYPETVLSLRFSPVCLMEDFSE